MTRLQRRNSSCDCGKTTKESRSFVTKNKTYETRSGVQKKQENGCQKEISVNTLNLRGKVYLKKMETSLVALPIRNGDARVKLLKSPSKMCSKRCNKVVSNGNTQVLLDKSLEKIITAKIKMDILDINNAIRPKEDSAISNGILAKEFVKTFNETNNKETEIQDGDFIKETHKINGVDVVVNGIHTEVEIKKEEFVSTETHTNGDVESTGEERDNNDTELKKEAVMTNKKGRGARNKRTTIELLIKETCENLGLGIVNDKRTRKTPASYSPESTRKYKSEEIKVITTDQKLTLKGVPFKKPGRKPRTKGPILHYLDLYVKNKNIKVEKTETEDISTTTEGLVATTLKEELVNNISYDEDSFISKNDNLPPTKTLTDIKIEVVNDLRKVSLCSTGVCLSLCERPKEPLTCTDTENELPVKKRKKKSRKIIPKKKKKVDKIEASEYKSAIVHVLGYRMNTSEKEMLVLFENGTSNWIPYSEKEFDVTDIKEFYQHSDQDISIVNRLGYQTFFPQSENDSDATVTSDSDFSSATSSVESESDEVFFRTIPFVSSPRTIISSVPKPTTPISSNRCPLLSKEMLSEKDLNDLCKYVMSSKHIKLYPYEKAQEVLIKKDEGFVNIFLKKLIPQLKKGECLNLKTCEKLINTLEDCAVDKHCKVVVMNGVEEYFASNSIFEKLLKKTSALEGEKYEQDVSMLRYLIQTIRNFNKPIVGVIKKTANGLPASLLSLFDMVFHEKNGEYTPTVPIHPSKKMRKAIQSSDMQNEDSDSSYPTEGCQTFVFPRLMGLTESNESRIMGEQTRPISQNDITTNVPYFNGAPLSQQLRCSVRHMRNNSKIQMKRRGRSQSTDGSDNEVCSVANDLNVGMEDGEEPANRTDSAESLSYLEKQIKLEKEKTEHYMAELMLYLDSMENMDVEKV